MKKCKKKAMVLTLGGNLSGFVGESTDKMITYWANVANGGVVLIDLSKLDFVDSLGMAALKKASSLGNIAFCSPSFSIAEFMEDENISPTVNIYDSIEEAVERLGLELSGTYVTTGERRRHPRVSICVPAKLTAIHENKQGTFKGAVTNISLSGVLAEYLLREGDESPFIFARGMPIAHLDLSALRKDLVVSGTLARLNNQNHQTGLGISFSDLAQPKRQAISDYVRERIGEQAIFPPPERSGVDGQ